MILLKNIKVELKIRNKKMLLNSKSIIDCNEDKEVIHNKEIKHIIDQLNKLPNYECLVIKKDYTQSSSW